LYFKTTIRTIFAAVAKKVIPRELQLTSGIMLQRSTYQWLQPV